MAVLPVGIGPVTGYNIERSLRFNSADTAYLNRTPATTTNRKTFTWSGWYKRSALGTVQVLFGAGTGTSYCALFFTASDTLEFQHRDSAVNQADLITTQVFRDVGAWYHIMVAVDTTQSTSSNRIKIYVNGSQITAFSTATYFSLNYDNLHINVSTSIHYIGSLVTSNLLNGYLTEVNFIDGSALTPSSFGETDTNTGVWKPKAFSGTYGTNGFYLKFADNSGTTSTTLGKDSSGNGNNWTPNNFSVTAGAGNDSLVDSPTNYGSDTGAGGEVRGNYATLNPLNKIGAVSASDGNLVATTTSASGGESIVSSIGVTTGKWYAELKGVSFGSAAVTLGVFEKIGNATNSFIIRSSDGVIYVNNVLQGTYGSFTAADTIAFAVNADLRTVTCYKNNVQVGSTGTIAGTDILCIGVQSSGAGSGSATTAVNFGQRPFAYTAPSGFKALCTQNLPTPTIGATSTTQANDYFDVVLRTSAGSAGSSVTSLNFQPDFIWDKTRSITGGHYFEDAVRGVGKYLLSNSTAAEQTDNNYISAFTSNGFTIGNNDWAAGTTIVDWCWKANGAGSTNTAGTITSTVSANTTSGFSIVTFNIPGSGTSDTVGHGLGVAPSMVILKPRTAGTSWGVYHSGLTSAAYYLTLQTTNGQTLSNNWWNSTAPTSSVFTIGATWYGTTNAVAYCFAPVAGYSAFGSYTGNGAADGPFVYTGFRPRYVLIKPTASTGGSADWLLIDSARYTYNVSSAISPAVNLVANSSAAEDTNLWIQLMSNGFKCASTQLNANANGVNYIYAAFAESPFKYSLAR